MEASPYAGTKFLNPNEMTNLLQNLSSFCSELAKIDSPPILWERSNFESWLESEKPKNPREYLELLKTKKAPIHFIFKVAVHMASGEDSGSIDFLVENLLDYPEFEYSPPGGFGLLFHHLVAKLNDRSNVRNKIPLKKTIAILAGPRWNSGLSQEDKDSIERVLKDLEKKDYYPAFRAHARLAEKVSISVAIDFLISAHNHCPPRPGAEILKNEIIQLISNNVSQLSLSDLRREWIRNTRTYLSFKILGIEALSKDLDSGDIKIEDNFFNEEAIAYLLDPKHLEETGGRKKAEHQAILNAQARLHRSIGNLDAAKNLLLKYQLDPNTKVFEVLSQLADQMQDPQLKKHLAWSVVDDIDSRGGLQAWRALLILAEKAFRESAGTSAPTKEPFQSIEAERSAFFKRWSWKVRRFDPKLEDPELGRSFARYIDLFHVLFSPYLEFDQFSPFDHLKSFQFHVEVLKHFPPTNAPLSESDIQTLEQLKNSFYDRDGVDLRAHLSALKLNRESLINWILFKHYSNENKVDELKKLMNTSKVIYDSALKIDMREQLIILAQHNHPWALEKLAADFSINPTNYSNFSFSRDLSKLLKTCDFVRASPENRLNYTNMMSFFIRNDFYNVGELLEINNYLDKASPKPILVIRLIASKILSNKSSEQITPEITQKAIQTLRSACNSPRSKNYSFYLETLYRHTNEYFPCHWFTNSEVKFDPNTEPGALLKDQICFAERCLAPDLNLYTVNPDSDLKVNLTRLPELAPTIEDSSFDQSKFEAEMSQVLDEILLEKHQDLKTSFMKLLKSSEASFLRKVAAYIQSRAVQDDSDPQTLVNLLTNAVRHTSKLLTDQSLLSNFAGSLRQEIIQLNGFVPDKIPSDEETLQIIDETLTKALNTDRLSRSGRYFPKLQKYYTEQSDDGKKFRFFANHLLTLDPTKKKERVLIYFENLDTCNTGVKEANEQEFQRARLESSSILSEQVRQAYATPSENLPFHPLVDLWVRAIKENIVNQDLLSGQNIRQEARRQRVHLTVAMRRILGKDLGILSANEQFSDDPLQTVSIQTAFESAGVKRVVDWKSHLLREFFYYYTPDDMIDKFRDLANQWLAVDNTPRYNQLVKELFPSESENLGDIFSWNENAITLTTKGAQKILLKYRYLIQAQK